VLDPQRQFKYGSSFNLSFPDYPSFTRKPTLAVLYQEMGAHDILELTFTYSSSFLLKTLTTGTPMKFTWNSEKASKTFYGYVSHISPMTQQTITRSVTVSCIGSSYPLKETASKIYTNITGSEFATQVAKQFNLNPVVTNSTVRFSQISMAGHSYFEKLNEVAKKIGWSFQVDNTNLYFNPIDTQIDKFMDSIPMLSFLDPYTNNTAQLYSQTLNSFKTKLGDYVESDVNNRSNKVVAGVDPVTGVPYKAISSPKTVGTSIRTTTKDPLFSKVESGTVANSNAMAKAMADAKAQLSRLSIPGSGEAQGDPRISPWRTIQINGTGSLSDGYWIVKSAEHIMNINGKYTTNFTCATDGINDNRPSPTRPGTSAGITPVSIASSISTASNAKTSSTKLSAAAAMVSQSQSGFNVVPRRWVTQ
jgi:phage protein D